MFSLSLLAVEGAAEMLEQGLTMSDDIGAIYDLQWQQIFMSELYGQIVDLAKIFAVGALVIFMMRFAYAAVHEGDYSEPVRMLVWPLIVVLFLVNDGQLLAAGTTAMRNVLNEKSEQVLKVSMLNVRLEEAIRGALAKGVIGVEISSQIQQCQALIGESQVECLEAAYQQVEATIGDFQQHWAVGAAHAAGSLVTPFYNQITEGIRGAIDAYETSGGSVGQVLPGFFGGFVGSTSRALVHALLMAFQWAFVNLVQISMLLTALVGPIALAASLLPFGGKPIFAWLTGFFSLGFAQIMYNIVVGLAAVVIMNANTFDTNGYLVLIALLSPALALGLASGGGLAIFNIMLSGSVGAATLLVSTYTHERGYSSAARRSS
ncbi:MAG: hypothetical protein F6K00_33670 [Leptolyngbya sp. SIOISBB]|nr:hypothetical protein [Leptolyngbya sp. SIOISBB]